ncbi:hypothetical protein SAMN06265375_101456 [Muriicola jejuensis]|uniref:Uncharacterized protein n=1 Tax=Muriicola jejuensis TaxID=504488 RepID=A0A6P0UIJ5_9FLAO|nr:DUF6090 family protein [Muriicola jejuensis]NER10016.1 hypothetical protein [Muriicola jejuensis]SMP03742.1 hypothetical protein SAMN06265375_101456 [Muriicola jejuensis]
MLRFFRQLRQRLLTENRVSKYLLYAIGEIILVVIGILIALQINNWNEDKKLRTALNAALEEVREDLVMDTLHLHQEIAIRMDDLESQSRVIQVLQEKQGFTEQTYADLGRVMLQRPTTLLSNGYDLINELGMSNLNDRMLRNALVGYYEHGHSRIKKELADDIMEFEDAWLPYVRSHFSEWDFGEKAIPLNNQQIKEDSWFLMTLKMNLINLTATLDAHAEALQNARELIAKIDSVSSAQK